MAAAIPGISWIGAPVRILIDTLELHWTTQDFYSTARHAMYDIHMNETYIPIQNIDLQRRTQDGKVDCSKSHRIENCSNIEGTMLYTFQCTTWCSL